MKTHTGYSGLQILLHWATATLLWAAGAHAAVLLWHHHLLHDRVLLRMARPE